MKSPGKNAIANRRWVKSIGFALAVFTACYFAQVSAVSAAIAVGDTLKFDLVGTKRIASTGGGEFRFVMQSGMETGNAFFTFCLERNEFLDFSNMFTVSSISNLVVNGGVSDGVSGGPYDPISLGTNYLFSQYSAGTLEGFGGYTRLSGNNNVNNAWGAALQAVIWRLEDEVNSSYNGLLSNNVGDASGDALDFANSLWTALTTTVFLGGTEKNDAPLLSLTTKAMNIVYTSNGVAAQSQIIAIPQQIIEVPAPATIVIWSGLAGLGLIAGRFRRRNAA